jgi:hypothetical protein
VLYITRSYYCKKCCLTTKALGIDLNLNCLIHTLYVWIYFVSKISKLQQATITIYCQMLSNVLRIFIHVIVMVPMAISNICLLKGIGNTTKKCIASSARAWKNKPIGRLMLYSISSSSEVICKNAQNLSCWFSTTCDVISWVSMFNEY